MKTKLYTLTMFTDSMGSFKQPGCSGESDALWHVNNARDHDGLERYTPKGFRMLLHGKVNWGWAKLTPEN